MVIEPKELVEHFVSAEVEFPRRELLQFFQDRTEEASFMDPNNNTLKYYLVLDSGNDISKFSIYAVDTSLQENIDLICFSDHLAVDASRLLREVLAS